jgi:hypothetical protein
MLIRYLPFVKQKEVKEKEPETALSVPINLWSYIVLYHRANKYHGKKKINSANSYVYAGIIIV